MKARLLLGIFLLGVFMAGGGYTIHHMQAEKSQAAKNSQITQANPPGKEEDFQQRKALIVYFSHTGHTRLLAQTIQEITGADIFEVQPATRYPQNYDVLKSQVAQEVTNGYLPKLKDQGPDLSAYDVIFVGTPVWHYAASPAIVSFLTNSELKGKIIMPFITHGGFGSGHSADDIKNAANHSLILEELSLKGNMAGYSKGDIMAWLNKNGFGE